MSENKPQRNIQVAASKNLSKVEQLIAGVSASDPDAIAEARKYLRAWATHGKPGAIVAMLTAIQFGMEETLAGRVE